MAEPMSFTLLTLVVIAVLLDLVIGDPRSMPHPVVGMGKVIGCLERSWNHGTPRARRLKGGLMTSVVVIGTYILASSGLMLLARLHPWLKLVAELWLLVNCLAIKGLRDAALAVATPLIQGDLTTARQQLAMVVGRDTAYLDEPEITRGTVETVAENSVDGITAPLLFALLGGAPLALAYKAINTLDSMVGYRNERYREFGWASARLDDVANWFPARLTALTLWLSAHLLRGMHTRGALSATYRDAAHHPSPNAGLPEAMVANLLGVQLGGMNTYQGDVSCRTRLGIPRETLAVRHIEGAIRLMHGGWLGFLAVLVLLIVFKEVS
ncbi:adenosylcobinamide-phosphate synthase CbiB [Aidingimonas lacisalsi]|uniref:adenosylcobinamide-phosphate synthase CbiB n=1 Tax=Aidingimonas lacisalsi TaxID=2604086 RepID=UPI001F01209E|nr:adenosylcobinamide-phosphate synthase CbiB [Aidingimonas lacisalsi]